MAIRAWEKMNVTARRTPKTTTTEENITNIHEMVLDDRRIKLR
jgi:hypothetical protein